MPRRFLTLLALSCLLPGTVAASARSYGANEHESQWAVTSSPLQCRLRHTIPMYGEAEFGMDAGGELGFTLKVYQRPFRTGEARLLSVPPAWMHEATIRDLGTIDFTDARPPFHLPRPQSRRLLAELERGMFPTLSFKDWADGSDEVNVHLSAINVRDALGQFRGCLTDILPFSFEKVRISRLHFDFGKTALNAAARQRLDDIARYVAADERIQRIELQGHTDNRGFRTFNRKLATQRTEAVRAYLTGKGIAPSLFKIRASGERNPIATNRTAQGRALNRRVDIELIH